MKRVLLAASAAILAGAISSSALAQTQGTGNVSATIVAPITIDEDRELNFGLISASAAAGTVTIDADADGDGLGAGGATLLGGSPHTSAIFTVNGAAGTTYDVSLPTTAITLDDGAGNEMDVTLVLGGVTSGIAGGGDEVVYVGGELTVAANQVPGDYTGTYTIEALYN